MKKILIILCLLPFAAMQAGALPLHAGKTSLSGQVTDEAGGAPLAGATISFPDLQVMTITDSLGRYSLDDLPLISLTVQVYFVGYNSLAETIDLSSVTHRDFKLQKSIVEVNKVTVSASAGVSQIRQNPVPIISINHQELMQTLSTNAIDAISRVAGVSAVSTGPNVSKPFIRGLGYNRVLTLYDGVRIEGQQWGDEHGVEVDEYNVDQVEVVKGPASLIYGSDALAGVVNLLPARPLPEGKINGEFLVDYQSNNQLLGTSLALNGNHKGFIWGARTSFRMAKNYQDPVDGRVYGTSFQEKDATAFLGVNKHWGYTKLTFTAFDDLQSIPDGSRDSVSRRFTKQITEADTVRPIVSDAELNSYTIPVLHQQVQHYRLVSSSKLIWGKSKIGLTLGAQQSIRQEFSHPEDPQIAGLDLQLNTFTYDVKYFFPQWHHWDLSAGLNGMYQQNRNLGTEFVIPDYNQFDFGPFVYLQKSAGKLHFSAGLRYDHRSFHNDSLFTKPNPITGFDEPAAHTDSLASRVFSGGHQLFSGFSGSLGMTCEVSEKFLVKANIAQGFRAPNIAEISANGVHPGTNIYQLGNAHFQPEQSLQEDLGVSFISRHINGDLEVFNNQIRHYIYNEKLLNHLGGDSVIVPGNQTFQFQAATAQLYGLEASIDIHPHPLDWLHFKNSISVVEAFNRGVAGVPVTDSTKYLPFIPPLHTLSTLRAEWPVHRKYWRHLYMQVELEVYAAQRHVFSAFGTETPTSGYALWNAGMGVDLVNHKGNPWCSLHLLGSNLGNLAYESHMSRLKYFEPYPGNPSGHDGIYNMGRNLCVKAVFPLQFK